MEWASLAASDSVSEASGEVDRPESSSQCVGVSCPAPRLDESGILGVDRGEFESAMLGKDAAAEAKEDPALGRLGSGVMVVRRVSHRASESGLVLRCRSPRPLVPPSSPK